MTLHVQRRFDGFDYVGAYAASVVLAVLAIATLLAMNFFRPKEGARGNGDLCAERDEALRRLHRARGRLGRGTERLAHRALLRPSGSGKSTLLRVIAGSSSPIRGRC